MTLLANGVPFPIARSEAEDVAEYLVAMKRAIPYHAWMIDPSEAERTALDRLF